MKTRADQITYALSKRHKSDIFLTEVKTDSTWVGRPQRCDAVAVKPSWTNPCITIYEVKVSRNDFMQDEKYVGYLPLCHRFYFAAPLGIIKPDELREDIGLITYNPDTGGLRTVRKALYKPLESLPTKLLYYLVLSRTDRDHHPFFTETRDYLEAWVEDKGERFKLSGEVRDKIKRLHLLEDGRVALEYRQLESKAAELEKIYKIFEEHGVSRWGWEADLRERFNHDMPVELVRDLKTMASIAERINKKHLVNPNDGR